MATRRNVTGSVNTTGRTPIQYPPEPEFTSNLTSSLIPSASVGTITYSRATAATVQDHEGVIRQCLSGEARFQGARRVRNLTPYSQDVNISWNRFSLTVSGTKVAYTDGSLIGQTIISAAASAVHYVSHGTGPVIIGNTYLFSVSVKAAGVNFVQLAFAASTAYQNFDLTNGSMTGTAGAGSVVDEGNGWYRCTVKFVSTLGTNAGQGIVIISSMSDARLLANLGDGVSGISICRMQLEDVTGQSVQTPSEYVSTNVLSSPFHGAMVDGVKYFDTDINGNPIPENTLKGFLCEGARTNLFLQSEDFLTTWSLISLGTLTANQAIAPDGRMTADLFTLGATLGSQGVTQSVTTTAAVYAQSIYVKPNGQNYIQCNAAGGISLGYVNFDLSNGTVGTQSLWTGTIESLPNGWYRIKVITDTISATTANVSFSAVPSATSNSGQTMAGTGTSGFYIWGAQFELGPSASSYIPTTTVTVTRNIDVLTYNVRNAIANQGAFSAVFTMDDYEQFDRRALNFSMSNNNRLQFQVRRFSPLYPHVVYGIGTSARVVAGDQQSGTNNIAVAWTNGVSVDMYMNNTKYSSVDILDLIFSTVDVGGGAVGLPIFGYIKNLRIWKTPPTDTELLFLSNNP